MPVERATACGFGAIFAIAPSPAADGVVWVGTNNGRVHADPRRRRPLGERHAQRARRLEQGEPDRRLGERSGDRLRGRSTATAAIDLRPQAFRTHDYGATWTEIGHGLPGDEWLAVVRQDALKPRLLYAGTQRGVRVSFDDGESWQSLQLGLPTTGINDLLIKGDDVVVATQGRAIWSLDAVTPLRSLADVVAAAAPALLPPAPAVRLRGNQNRDTPLPPEEPRAENPPTGAVLDYWLPGEPAGAVSLEIAAADGTVVRRFSSDDRYTRPPANVYFAERWLGRPAPLPKRAGHNRFVWNLRGPQPRALDYEYAIAAVPGGEASALPQGAFVLPGRYEARLTVDGRTLRQPLEVKMDPRVSVSIEDLRALGELQARIEAALAESAKLAEEVEEASTRQERLAQGSAANAGRAKAVLEAFNAAPRAETAAAVNADLATLATDLESADASPTAAQRALLGECTSRLAAAQARWQGPLGAALRKNPR